MSEAAVTSKGQITIPAEVRRRMSLEAKDRVVFTVLPDGTTIMRAKNRPVSSLAGMLRGKHGRVAIKDMRMD